MVPKTVIISDNDKFQRQLADMLLAADNYNIIEFSSGKDTLQYLKENTPDIALLASDLSDISGADICSKMKRNSRLKKIPVILISSQLQHETVNALARAVHADLVLEKPLGDKHLKEEVRTLLGKGINIADSSDNILILENESTDKDSEYFYMDTTIVEQTIPVKETLVSSDNLPPLNEAASVEIQNIFIGSEEEVEENENINEVIFGQELDVIDAIEKDLEKQQLEEDKTNISEVIAAQEDYERESWRKELEPQESQITDIPIIEPITNLTAESETVPDKTPKEELLFLKSKLEEFIEENESLKSALLELKSGKSLVSTESFLDSMEELEALRRLTESQQKQIQNLRRENKILRKSMESFLARQKNPLWGNRDSKIN